MGERILSVMIVLVAPLMLAGCGEDGAAHDAIDVTSTQRPTASFTLTPTTGDWPLAVSFDGSASADSDGTISRYSWNFGDGSAGTTGATTSHTYTSPGTFDAKLTVTDDAGAQGSISHPVVVTGPVTLSGRITYDRVPFATTGTGLDYSRTSAAPARGVVVELLGSNGSSLASTVTSSDGRYQFIAPESTDVSVRASAELLRTSAAAGQPGWNVRIRNNTNANALYVLDGSLRNTGVVNQTRNLHAASGWTVGGTTYSGTRAAAPFAIADTLYDALDFIVTNGNSSQIFQPLDAYWSTSNRPVAGDDDFSDGEIGSSQFVSIGVSGTPAGIYILGDDGVDTDEFDTHVIAHEFLHFVEATLSGSDSIGGEHAEGDQLDLRVAFSEGMANAFSAMALDDSVLRDSLGAAQGDTFELDVEDNTWTNRGWFSEGSVGSIVWDLYDSVSDGVDTTSIPFQTLYDVQLNELRTTPALTSLFVFIAGLKTRSGLNIAAIDDIVEGQAIVGTTIDAFGTTETHDGGIAEALPVYTEIALGGPTRQVCGVGDTTSVFNKLGNRRFLRFTVPTMRAVTILVVGLEAGAVDTPAPNPDLALYRTGFLAASECDGPTGGSCTQPTDTEQYQATLPAGDYVLDVHDRSHVDDSNGVRPSTCMNVTVTG